ncbi:peroxin [Irineochytrium annulatum]|nr:peroxin [Irineochytrium annulatum]
MLLPLDSPTNFETLCTLVSDVRGKVEFVDDSRKQHFKFSSLLLPEEGKEAEVLKEGGAGDEMEASKDSRSVIDEDLQKLLDEIRDYMDSPDFDLVVRSCLDQSFVLMEQQLRPTFYPDEAPGRGQLVEVGDVEAKAFVVSGNGKEIKLAAILPPVSRLVNSALNSEPNLFVDVS